MNHDLDTAIIMHAGMVKDGNCKCDSETGVGCELCFTWGVLNWCKRKIEQLRSENAALTAERDELKRNAPGPFTVTVEIPELSKGECSTSCKLHDNCDFVEDKRTYWPGPGCPRYQKPEEQNE